MRRRAVGFTLIEVMIVIVLGLILAGVALPSAHSLDDQQVEGLARVLQSDVEFARARAIATGQTHRVLFDLAGQRYQVESPPGVLLDDPLVKSDWIRAIGPEGELLDVDFGGGSALLIDGAGQPQYGGQVVLAVGEFIASATVAAVTGDVTLTLP